MSTRTKGRYYDDDYTRDRDYRNAPAPKAGTPEAFAAAKTLYIYQVVQDVKVGRGVNDNGEYYDMTIPVPLDFYFSEEYGGRQALYPMSEWKSTNKTIIIRGYLYNGRILARAVKEGRELEAFMGACYNDLEQAVNFYFNPPTAEVITKVVTPTWAWISLLMTVAALVMLALSIAPK